MLFITNRVPNESIKSAFGRRISFNLDVNAPLNSIYYCERRDKNFNIEIGWANFLNALNMSARKQIMLYIHGYSNLPEEHIFPKAIKLQKLFDSVEKDFVLVVPIIWPCDNDFGVVKDYWDDRKSAEMSAFAFARALSRFINWLSVRENSSNCDKKLNILAHSMGAYVLQETLNQCKKFKLLRNIPKLFSNTFLLAADLSDAALNKGKSGELISKCSESVIVYFADDDMALYASQFMNLMKDGFRKRIGNNHRYKLNKFPSNFYFIDCDRVNNEYDHPAGHTYFLHGPDNSTPGVVFKHILQILKNEDLNKEIEFDRSVIL